MRTRVDTGCVDVIVLGEIAHFGLLKQPEGVLFKGSVSMLEWNNMLEGTHSYRPPRSAQGDEGMREALREQRRKGGSILQYFGIRAMREDAGEECRVS